MAGTRLNLSGEGTWVSGFASTNNETVRILLVNFDPKASHNEEVPVRITNLASGSYRLRQQFLLGRDTTAVHEVPEHTLTTDVFMAAQSVAILELKKLP